MIDWSTCLVDLRILFLQFACHFCRSNGGDLDLPINYPQFPLTPSDRVNFTQVGPNIITLFYLIIKNYI